MKIYYFILIALKKIYSIFFLNKKIYYRSSFNVIYRSSFNVIYDADIVSEKIYNLLVSNKPCMIARLGANEASIASNYTGINSNHRSILNFITGNCPPWWWNKRSFKSFNLNAGFFPIEIPLIEKYCKLMLSDLPQIDIFGSLERVFFSPTYYKKLLDKNLQNALKVKLDLLEPYFSNKPWSRVLEGKKVLVVHPFQKSIEQQYQKRELLFKNNLLPKFELKNIKAVQSMAHESSNKFNTWFEALNSMKQKMDKIDYDIVLIGCGAYGFHLAAHAKRMGKKSIHLGGALQILFGIIGNRYEDPKHANGFYPSLFNEHWTRPMKEEKPKNFHLFGLGIERMYW